MTKSIVFCFTCVFAICMQAQSVKDIAERVEVLSNNGEYERVISLLDNNKDLFSNSDIIDYKLFYNEMLGYAYFKLQDYIDAELFYIETISYMGKIYGKENRDYELALNVLAIIYQKLGNVNKAIDYYIQVKNVQEKTIGREHPEYIVIIQLIANLCYSQQDFNIAFEYFMQLKDLQENSIGKEHSEYAQTIHWLGSICESLRNHQKAEEYLLNEKEIREKILEKEHPDYVITLYTLGSLYSTLGNYQKAEKYYLDAKDIGEKILEREHPDYLLILNNLGELYCRLGNYSKAEEYLCQTKEIQEKTIGKEHLDYASTLNNLGGVYNTLGNYQKAEEYYLQVRELREKILGKDHPQYATILNNLGLLYQDVGNYSKAEEYYLQAKEIRKKTIGEESPDYAHSIINLGLLYHTLGNYQKVEEYLLQTKKIQEKTIGKEHPDYANTLNSLGGVYNTLGNYQKAEEYYLQAKEIREKTIGKEHPDYARTLSNLFALHEEVGDLLHASDYILESCQLTKKQVSKNFEFLSEQQRELFWTTRKDRIESTYSLIYKYLSPRIQTGVYDNILFSKGLLLQTTNAIRNTIQSSGNQDLINKYNTLRNLRQQITALQTKKDSLSVHFMQSLELNADSLDKILTISSVLYRDEKSKFNIEWQNIRDNLSENEIAIEFISFDYYNKQWTDSTLYAAMILKKDCNDPKFIPLFEEKELNALINQENLNTDKFVNKLYTSGNAKFFSGEKLYQLIWQPLEKYLQGIETVYYSPSGTLNQIAFAAIPVDSFLLIDKYNLHLVSSTREVVHKKKDNETFFPIQKTVEYGGIQYDVADATELITAIDRNTTRSAWGYLDGTAMEVLQIDTLLKKSGTTRNVIYMGLQAHEESFKQLSGNSPELLHIATHGFFLEDEKDIKESKFMQRLGDENNRQVFKNPLLRSGLLMAGANRAWLNKDVIEGIDDGILTADEIANLDLSKTKLVVLSACETGLGEVQNSEGVFGLQRAFKLAGVETLVMSLWKVPDATTSELMIAFYKNLLSGKTKQESFKIAQKEVRGKYRNPYYWAGFVMMD